MFIAPREGGWTEMSAKEVFYYAFRKFSSADLCEYLQVRTGDSNGIFSEDAWSALSSNFPHNLTLLIFSMFTIVYWLQSGRESQQYGAHFAAAVRKP